MRNFKKIIAVLITLSMLLSAVALTAFAGETPTVRLVGRTQVEQEDTYLVDFMVSDAEDIGGVQGTITYDASVFTYQGVEFTKEFDDVNKRTDNVLKHNEETGTIAFIGINPGNDAVWFTLKFKATNLTKDASFDINSEVLQLKVSTKDGKDIFFKTSVEFPKNIMVVKKEQMIMKGATIRAEKDVNNQDLKVETKINYDGDLEVVECGVIFLPAQLLPKGAELNCDPNYIYGLNSKGNPIKGAVARKEVVPGDGVDYSTIYATLSGSSTFNAGALLQVDIMSRAYIKLEDGSVIYTNNDFDGTSINDGYARKSIIGIAKDMAKYILTQNGVEYTEKLANAEAVQAFIDKLDDGNKLVVDKEKDIDEPAAFLEFVVNNKDLLPKEEQ